MEPTESKVDAWIHKFDQRTDPKAESKDRTSDTADMETADYLFLMMEIDHR